VRRSARHLPGRSDRADLAGVARMCAVSRARVSEVVGLLGMAGAEKERLITSGVKTSRLGRHDQRRTFTEFINDTST
jgi:hypothetical protein